MIGGQKIGEGGFSHVVKHVQYKGGKNINVAIKMIKESKISYYLMEILILSSIDHPYIVRCHGIDYDDNLIYISEELAECDLYTYIKTRCIIVQDEKVYNQVSRNDRDKEIVGIDVWNARVIVWFHQILQALAFLHSNNIVHLDVKPSNILIFSDKCVKLADFSYSRFCVDIRGSLGTNCYKSPEVLKGYGTGQKSDIWSLGNTLYFMKYGQIMIPCQFKDKQDLYLRSINSMSRMIYTWTEIFRSKNSKSKHVIDDGNNYRLFDPDLSMYRMINECRNISDDGNSYNRCYIVDRIVRIRYNEYIDPVLDDRFILAMRFMDNIGSSIESIIYQTTQYYPYDRPSAIDILRYSVFDKLRVMAGSIKYCSLESQRIDNHISGCISKCLSSHDEITINSSQRRQILNIVRNNSYNLIKL